MEPISLKYQVEDSTLAELLGRQNFSNQYSAILEIVKNSYDALAKNITIQFTDDKLCITDNGIGMTQDDIIKKWMHVGNSDKNSVYSLREGTDERVLSGSKGVGRFALARLGDYVEIKSKKTGSYGVLWKTNWDNSTVESIDSQNNGTEITISELRDKWSETEIGFLNYYLSRTINDSRINVEIKTNEKSTIVIPYFDKKAIKKNQYQSRIDFNFDANSNLINVKIENDEFSDKALEFVDGINIKVYEKTLNAFDQLKNGFPSYSNDEFLALLKSLGSFSGILYFSHAFSKTADIDYFCYNDNKFDFLDHGVILYRNAFSISSYEGEKDWLEFGKRSRLSPAGPSHLTGSWRVRENNISGYVLIDRNENSNLREMSNRQGLEETNIYFSFIKIIQLAIEEYERYRQSIIRNIVKNKKKEISVPNTKVLNVLNKNPEKIKDLSVRDTKILLEEIKEVKEKSDNAFKAHRETESKYRYDVRILNTLATSGLKASSIAHELKNDTAFLEGVVGKINDGLAKMGLLNQILELSSKITKSENVPYLLQRDQKINKKTIGFIETLLSGVMKSQFIVTELFVLDEINNIISFWEEQYALLSFNINIPNGLKIKSSPDILRVIFDNLILNSVQQNANKKITISICINKENSFLRVEYMDNGVGLPNKFIDDPYRILEVHQTSREDGHGLGMWIVNNTILSTNGRVLNIDGHNGFAFKFLLGKEL